MKDYKKKFKEHYNIDFEKDYVIHHIDLNKNNNEITNFMIMPKKLHQTYHFLLNSTCNTDEKDFRRIYTIIHSTCICGDQYNLSMMSKLLEILNECNKWYDYKLYLDGIIANIHNLEVK